MSFPGNARDAGNNGGAGVELRPWFVLQGQTCILAWRGMVKTMKEREIAPFEKPYTQIDSSYVRFPRNAGHGRDDGGVRVHALRIDKAILCEIFWECGAW